MINVNCAIVCSYLLKSSKLFFEILALLVMISVFIFWFRRNMMNIKRFISNELKGWPKNDANYILYIEIILMSLFLNMNAADLYLQSSSYSDIYHSYGYFPVSQYITPLYSSFSDSTVLYIERVSWWLHILVILFFNKKKYNI